MPELLPRFRRLQQQIEDERRIAAIVLGTADTDTHDAGKLLRPSADGPRVGAATWIAHHQPRCLRSSLRHNPVAALLAKERRGDLGR